MRLSALALLLAFAVPTAGAQIIPQLDIGVAGGVNFANLGDARSLELGSSTGYHVGAYADVGLLFFSARTGIYYLWAGELTDAANVNQESVSFITVPLDFQLQTPTPFVQAYILAGPEFRFPVSSFTDNPFQSENVNTIINIGVGVSGGLPLFGPSGFAELRYGYDATGFGNEAGSTDDARLNLILLRVGLGI